MIYAPLSDITSYTRPTHSPTHERTHNSGGRKEAGVVRNYPSAWTANQAHGRGANPELEREEDLRLLLCGAVRTRFKGWMGVGKPRMFSTTTSHSVSGPT